MTRPSRALALAVALLLVALLAGAQGAAAHKAHEDLLSSGATLGLVDDSNVFGQLAGPSPLALGDEPAPATMGPGAGLQSAGGDPNDIASANFHKLDRVPIIKHDGEHRAMGSDLAIQRKLLVAGTYQGIGFFRISPDGSRVRQISWYRCPGSQGDVSIHGDYVFVSIDSAGSNQRQSGSCNNTRARGADDLGNPSSYEREGIRVVDISDVRHPRQVAFVETECGSHTHTLVPNGDTTFMYVQSYPLNQQDSCTELNHPEGEISVLRYPTNDPERLQLVGIRDILPPSVTPDTVGCHDIGVLPHKDLAAAACLGTFAILDISNPANPQTLSTIQNPEIELDHSAQLTWDGKFAVIGDEHAGAAGGGGCSTDQDSPVGAMWYYRITDPANPVLRGSYSLPRVPPVDNADELERFRCTTHNYSILPMRNDRYVAVSPYYSGGLSVVDFTNPAEPREKGFYIPQVNDRNPDMWSGYWYDGRIYTNEHQSKLGVSVFRMERLGKNQVRSVGPRFNPQTQVR